MGQQKVNLSVHARASLAGRKGTSNSVDPVSQRVIKDLGLSVVPSLSSVSFIERLARGVCETAVSSSRGYGALTRSAVRGRAWLPVTFSKQ